MKTNKSLTVLSLLFVFMAMCGFGGAWGLVREGNKLFAQGKFDDALTRYTDAQLETPDNPALHYNIGTVLFKQKKYEEALKEFQKVTSVAADSNLKEKAFYNTGNVYFRQAQSSSDAQLLSKAVDAYTEALKIDPNDMDAKYNLEVARKMLELKKKEQPKQCNNPNNQNQNQNQNQSQNQNQQNNKAKQNENKNATSEAALNQQEGKTATSESQIGTQEGQMTREEAAQLLNALEQKERQNAQEQRQMRVGGRRAFAGKDW